MAKLAKRYSILGLQLMKIGCVVNLTFVLLILLHYFIR